MDAALVVTDERIRRFLGVAVDISAPRLGCVTASSLGGTTSVEIEVADDDVALIQFSSGTTQRSQAGGPDPCESAVQSRRDRALPRR